MGLIIIIIIIRIIMGLREYREYVIYVDGGIALAYLYLIIKQIEFLSFVMAFF